MLFPYSKNHDLLVKEKSISINEKNLLLKPYYFKTSICCGTDMLIQDSMEMWDTHVNLIFI